jgi:hypothetical protein
MGLDLGNYSVISDIITAAGKVYSKAASFTVKEPSAVPVGQIAEVPGPTASSSSLTGISWIVVEGMILVALVIVIVVLCFIIKRSVKK